MKLRDAVMCAASGFVLMAGQALAQQQPGDQSGVETVVVTGIKHSVKSALEAKKNSDQMQDSIVAEDIGKLPDNNVIEALQHVTGVQISRNAAEADQLLIRGLPDIATLLNGREVFTSTGRFITLQDVPAELLARVDVQKSSRADDIEGGIAGLIDVRLHRPFDFDGLQVAATLRGTYSSLSGHTDPSGSVLFSDRWQTSSGEWGLLVDLSASEDRYKEEILDNYISSQSIGPVPGSTGPGGIAFLPLTQGGQSINGDRKRTAADVSLQWSPNANAEFYLEGFYTRYRNPNNVDFFVGLPWLGANPATATVFPGTDEVKTVTAGGYDLTSDQSFVPKTDTYQLATGGTWTGDHMTLSTEVDYTDSNFSQTGYILDTEYYPPTYTADFNYHGTGTPFMQVSGIDLSDPSNYHIRQFYDQNVVSKGNEIDGRADLVYDLGDGSIFKSIDAGVRYVDRYAGNRQANGGGLDCRGNDPTGPGCFTSLAALPGSFHMTSGSIFGGMFGLTKWGDAAPGWLNSHAAELRTFFGQPTTPPPNDPTQTFLDREQSYAGYVKSNFGFSVGGLPVDGNVGLRLIETDSDTRGNTLVTTTDPLGNVTTTLTPTESKSDSFDWLPSLNARVTLDDNLFLRLAASRTVTHPEFSQLNPGLTLTDSTATLLGSGSSGNPNLSPEKSDNVDLSLEYYFGGQNALTGAVFSRKVDGYIVPAVNAETINGIQYQITTLANAPSGHIDGAEFGYTQFFDNLPGIWSGLGMQANATYVQGAFANISKWSYNLIGIYERDALSLRLAYNWRAGFDVGPAPGGGAQPGTIFAKAQPWLDFSAGYRVTDQITFTLDATNLLNSYYQDYFGVAGVYPRDTRRFDRTVILGVRYRM
jgi:iron complex outermembrane receptor protein